MDGISREGFKYVSDLVRRRAAIVLETGKEYLVESRLAPVAAQYGFASLDELVERLRADERGPLAVDVVEAMTTNETSFFRDVHPFETLRRYIVPEMMRARASTKTLRIWCAAASTGQEPYSIAMTLLEHFPELASWSVQIFATDLNRVVLERAKDGAYRQLEINRGLPASMLVKYFDRKGTEWQVKPELKRLVTFQQLNLLERWPLFASPDIVFMRNVLIYFDVAVKRDLLGRVRDVMRGDGTLLLGGAETTLNLDDRFEGVHVGPSVVYRARPPALRVAGL